MSFKDKVYDFFVRKDDNVRYEYERYVQEHIEEHYTNRMHQWKILWSLNVHYCIKKKEEPLIYWDRPVTQRLAGKEIRPEEMLPKIQEEAAEPSIRESRPEKVLYYLNDHKRVTVNQLVASIIDYDVISFDIFDTLIYRKVEKPNDIFAIMSHEMGINDFMDIRKKAENFARNIKEKNQGTREIVLEDIYDCLEERFSIDRKWMEREIELEIAMSMPNEYIHEVYEKLLALGGKIVFTTDMYLPLDVIKRILEKNGYNRYEQIFLSNEYKKSKGNGTLQKELLLQYPGKRIIHIGDNYEADVKKSRECGIDAMYNPDSHFAFREPELENLSASFYRAVIQTNMNNGLWNKDIYYSHGYRVGGILAVGYCNFINRIVRNKRIDKILFCSRDCFIINDIYNELYKRTEAEYIKISRFAIFNITSEHYLYDLSNRYIMKYIKMYSDSKTVGTILEETGFGYLIEECAKYNVNPYLFPSTIHDDNQLQEFLYKCGSAIYEHNKMAREAAKKYFSGVIGDSKNVLVVDIGWSGTCITALKYFIQKNMPELSANIYGALMCTNRNDLIKNSVLFDEIEAYLNTPFTNMDITRFIFPGSPKSRDIKEMDRLHMPFEYLFTSTESSLLSYTFDEKENVGFVYSSKEVENSEQIIEMQDGMRDFARTYQGYLDSAQMEVNVPPYTAFAPIREAISNKKYSYEVCKDFMYDAAMQVAMAGTAPVFGQLFDEAAAVPKEFDSAINGKKILFISPELIYSGAPRSMLRMCRVAKMLGYGMTVWSAKEGQFRKEFEKEGIRVEIVSEDEIPTKYKQIAEYDMAVCNTVVTSKYAEACCQIIPTAWYIREATNIPDFIKNNNHRAYTIRHSRDIYVVSEYAANALRMYADESITVVHNCVEDETEMASGYVTGTGEKIKFVQFGTMEYRKGYDVLLAAYKAMPEEYRIKSEVYFAGGFIASGASFCDYLFHEMKNTEGVHYIGLIQGEETKINTLSKMDVVVVASRDESCSLVALEGAMLSKPLIVTENVGAKYMVTEENGYIVETGNVEALKSAMMAMIDNKENLKVMGMASRKAYEEKASMKVYTKCMQELYALCDRKNTEAFEEQKERNKEVFSVVYKNEYPEIKARKEKEVVRLSNITVVSLTSHPGRINVVSKTIESLLRQTVKPKKIILVLSKKEFPRGEKDLPNQLKAYSYINDHFDIFWEEDDLKPHKKYFYTMQMYPDNPVIIVDDDVYYDEHLIENLVDSYNRFPDCISAMRTNLIGFKEDGNLMDYEGWIMGYRALQDIPSTLLIPTGVGGVLYPPHALPKEAFNAEAIKENCLFCDDIWLKLWACHAEIRTVMPEHFCIEQLLEGSQEVALWRMNVRQGNNNDESMRKTLAYYQNETGNLENLLKWIRKDRFS